MVNNYYLDMANEGYYLTKRYGKVYSAGYDKQKVVSFDTCIEKTLKEIKRENFLKYGYSIRLRRQIKKLLAEKEHKEIWKEIWYDLILAKYVKRK